MKICIIDCTLDKFLTRGLTRKTSSSAYSKGMRCVEEDILKENGGKAITRVDIESIRYFDIALLSLTSIQEIESYIVTTSLPSFRKGNCQVIAGGFGCINITSIYDYIDVAVFGRCDYQINEIIAGENFPNVWRKASDPKLEKQYGIGQFVSPQKKIDTGSIGCRMNCAYCQYTHVRLHDKKPYSPQKGATETDLWASDFTSPGVYTTAIDGLSESTRMKVCKPITDDFLLSKIQEAYSPNNKGKNCTIQLYNIVGYPWETESSVGIDMYNLIEKIKTLDRRTGKYNIKICFKNTPFSPEPLTPLESVLCNWNLSFRNILDIKYKGIDLQINQAPFLQGANTRKRRVAINRCTLDTRHIVRDFINEKEDVLIDDVLNNISPVPYLNSIKPLNKERYKEYEHKL